MKSVGLTGQQSQGALLVTDGGPNGFSFTTGATGSGIPPNNPLPKRKTGVWATNNTGRCGRFV